MSEPRTNRARNSGRGGPTKLSKCKAVQLLLKFRMIIKLPELQVNNLSSLFYSFLLFFIGFSFLYDRKRKNIPLEFRVMSYVIVRIVHRFNCSSDKLDFFIFSLSRHSSILPVRERAWFWAIPSAMTMYNRSDPSAALEVNLIWKSKKLLSIIRKCRCLSLTKRGWYRLFLFILCCCFFSNSQMSIFLHE